MIILMNFMFVFVLCIVFVIEKHQMLLVVVGTTIIDVTALEPVTTSVV